MTIFDTVSTLIYIRLESSAESEVALGYISCTAKRERHWSELFRARHFAVYKIEPVT